MDRREYVCNQMYKQHDLLRKGSWTDADKLEYMELNIAPYSRYWRMGMKKALKHAIRLLREEEAKADRKDEPTGYNLSPVEGEPTISKMEQVDKDINVRSKEPQTVVRLKHFKCPKCGRSDYIRSFEDWGIDGGIYKYKCINCNTYIKDEPQTDCAWK